jgi:hypothetical protein
MKKAGEAIVVKDNSGSPTALSELFQRARFVSTALGLTNILLLLIALSLLAIALQPIFHPVSVGAEPISEHRFFVEPGVQVLQTPDLSRSVYGRVVVDLRTGNIWGFPTSRESPYPLHPTSNKPETSHPFLLGRFALEDMDK